MYSEYYMEDISCHLAPDYRYNSFWVLTEITSADEYVDYITGKIQTLKETNTVIKTKMMYFREPDYQLMLFSDEREIPKPCLLLMQVFDKEPVCLFVERSANGLIARMDMMPAGFYDLTN